MFGRGISSVLLTAAATTIYVGGRGSIAARRPTPEPVHPQPRQVRGGAGPRHAARLDELRIAAAQAKRERKAAALMARGRF